MKINKERTAMWLGVVLVVVGVIFLLQSLGFVSGDVWDIVWPAVIIAIGVALLFKDRKDVAKKKKVEEKSETEEK